MSSLGALGGINGSTTCNNNRATVGRTLAGVLSGAAANIRSRFSHLNTTNSNSSTSPPTERKVTSGSSTPSLTNHNTSQSPPPPVSDEANPIIIANHHQQPQFQQYPQYSKYHNPQGGSGSHISQWCEGISYDQSGEQLAPTALPTTVPGAEVNDDGRGFHGKDRSTNSIPSSVQSNLSQSTSMSYTFGKLTEL